MVYLLSRLALLGIVATNHPANHVNVYKQFTAVKDKYIPK